ncbi:helix-turn-helix domain-containing protein [Sorangium sp. KYC3313]|uniref:helix-turn-helix domain-containing protein n=1 Tax=Sorangium sp. KYC3313 TaxID=3449740 RepID=UPI003F8A1EFA
MRHFLALARTGSVRAAGSMLGVSHSTVARRVEALEARLWRRLVPITLCNYVATAHAAQLDPERGARPARWLGSSVTRIVRELVASSSYPEVPIWGTFESMAIMMEAAHAGLGFVMLPTYAGDPEPGLQRLARPDLRHVADFWLLSHRDLRDNARLRAAREGITAALTARAALFRGEAEGWRETAPLRHELAPGAGAPRA